MRRCAIVLSVLVLVIGGSGCAYLTRASVSSGGQQANEHSAEAALSADGRFVAFSSGASNLVPGDTNDWYDVFVRDLLTKTTERVSIASDGTQGNDHSTGPAISGDGRYVAFTSTATNLVPHDSNAGSDVFVHDRTTGITKRVSVANGGAQANDESASASHAISDDGRYVAFASNATNLVPGDTNGVTDAFVRDRTAGTTRRVSVASDGAQSNSASAAFVDDLSPPRPHPVGAAMSANGRYVAFRSFGNDLAPGGAPSGNAYLRDLKTRTTALVNVALTGTPDLFTVDAEVSADGRYVAFVSYASNIVAGDTNQRPDGFVRDTQTGTTERVTVSSTGSQGSDSSSQISISGDGRWVVFTSDAPNLVPNDTNRSSDVFIRDRLGGTTRRVSTTALGGQVFGGNGGTISADGRYVAFQTSAPGVVGDDTNDAYDVFVRANPTPTVDAVSPTAVPRGASVSIAVKGSEFLPGDLVLAGDGVTVDHVTFVDPAHLIVQITVDAGAALGTRNVTVVGPGSGPGPSTGALGICASCLSIS